MWVDNGRQWVVDNSADLAGNVKSLVATFAIDRAAPTISIAELTTWQSRAGTTTVTATLTEEGGTATKHAGIDASTVIRDMGLAERNYFVVSAHREENVDEPDRLAGHLLRSEIGYRA